MATYKIGQVLVYARDVVVEEALSDEKITIPKGSVVIIGADNLAHHVNSPMIQPLEEDAVVKGYDATGIAHWLHFYLKSHYPIDELLEEDDCSKYSKGRFVREIEYALKEIGFC